MKAILEYLISYKTLDRQTAKDVLISLANGVYNSSQMSAFMTIFMMRSVTPEEMEGFRDAMLELCVTVDFDQYDAIDLCGTGGDCKDAFNISTLASFVTAGAGIHVVKHGNYGVSSISGSSNMMQEFGLTFTNDYSVLSAQMEKANICYLHAPFFHPAVKNIASVRKELGVKTFFNMLGPMINPAKPKFQLVGVFNLELARLYSYLYQNTDKQYNIVHALDGYDEISLTGPTKVFSREGDKIISPQDMGLPIFTQEELRGGKTVKESAKIFENVLKGKGTKAQSTVVLANAAMAIKCVNASLTFEDSFAKAKESLDSGSALKSFEKMLSIK